MQLIGLKFSEKFKQSTKFYTKQFRSKNIRAGSNGNEVRFLPCGQKQRVEEEVVL
jgi:hypothetical protein